MKLQVIIPSFDPSRRLRVVPENDKVHGFVDSDFKMPGEFENLAGLEKALQTTTSVQIGGNHRLAWVEKETLYIIGMPGRFMIAGKQPKPTCAPGYTTIAWVQYAD